MGKKRTRKSVRKHNDEIEKGVNEVLIFDPEEILGVSAKPLPFDVQTSPQQDLLTQLKRDTYRFYKTVIFALILHLSAVTLFKVVVYVPRSDLQYIQIQVVQTEVEPRESINEEREIEHLRISRQLEDLLREENTIIRPQVGQLAGNDTLELPRLEFEKLEKLRLRQLLVTDDVSSKPLVEEFKDSWAQFGTGIERIRESLFALNPFGATSTITDLREEKIDIPVLKQNVGRETELVYRWITPPYNRKILSLPVFIDFKRGEWEMESGNYDFLLTVNKDGEVKSVSDLNIQENEFIEYLKKEIEKIRFEPLFEEIESDQQVTIRIRSKRSSL